MSSSNGMEPISNIQRYELLIFVVLIAIGVFFRGIEFGNYPFNFDQVQILSKAEEISQGQLSLIGPRTGPANLFTGPLIYYITAFFVKILPFEYLVVTVPTLIAVATAAIVAICIRKDFAFRETVVFLIFWAFSPYLIQLDRVFWNPNFMFLAAALSFLPLIHAQKKHFSLDRALLLCAGGFLGYQAHFAGLALPALVVLVVILFRKNGKYAVASLLGLFLSLVPTLVFDIRNNWLNARGVVSLLTQSSSERNLISLIQEFGTSLFILVENTGKLVFWGHSSDSILTAGVVVLLVAVTFARSRAQLRVATTWLLGIAVFFSVYPGNKPEYYYIISLPALFLFFFSIARKVTLLPLSSGLLVFAIVSTVTNLQQLGPNGSLSLGSTVFVQQSISDIAQNQRVKSIIYDAPHAADIGYKYVLESIPLHPEGSVIHVSYPNFYAFSSVAQYGSTAIWIDPRVDSQKYLTIHETIMQYPPFVTTIEEQRHTTNKTVTLDIFTAAGKAGTAQILKQTKEQCPTAAVLDTQTGMYGFAPTETVAQLGKHCFYFEGSEQIRSQLRFY